MSKTLKTDNGVPVEIDSSIAGHLLWNAMADFRKEYAALTNLCHLLSVDAGGPCNDPPYNGAASYTVPEDHSVGMRGFSQRASEITGRMQNAIKRAGEFAYGEVYDNLIERTALGPQTSEDGRLRRLYVDDSTRAPVTFVHAENTGMHVYMGVNPETTSPQPFVVVSTEGMREHYLAESGEPILAVSLNDADLYDKEKE